jgi:hypothetical protein
MLERYDNELLLEEIKKQNQIEQSISVKSPD